MAEFTQDQILEIKKIIGDQYKMKGLNWRIVQSIPSLLEPNTLYFHQVSINPKKYDIYHTDKDKDIAKLDVYNQQVVDEKVGEVQDDFDKLSNHVDTAMRTAYLGIATTTTVPLATGAYWYRVDTAGTYTNFVSGGSPIVVTADELKINDVYFNIQNGVVTKGLSEKRMPSLSNATNGVSTVLAASEKATGDLRKITEDPQLIFKGAFFNSPYYEFDGSGNLFFKPTEFGGAGGDVFYVRGGYYDDYQCSLAVFMADVSTVESNIATFDQVTPLGVVGCVKFLNSANATLYYNPLTNKFIIQNRQAKKSGWIKLIENNSGQIGDCTEKNAILKSITKVASDKNRNISFISGTVGVPNIDTTTSIIDFGTDGQLIIGDTNYPLSDVKFRTVSLTPSNYAGSAVRLYFNPTTNSMVVRAFQNAIYGAPEKDEILIGSVRKGTNWFASFPFSVAINGSTVITTDVAKIRNSVSLIASIEGNIPAINETAETLDLGVNPLLVINGKTLDLAGLNPSDSSQYRAIPLKGSLTSSARKLYYNTTTNKFEIKVWSDDVASNNLILIGGIRKTTSSNRIEANFPFAFRRSLDKDSKVTFRDDAGVKFIAHRGSTFFDVPENTIDSVIEAKKLGFKYTEFDFMETSDREFVVMHDLSINRTCINNDGSDISGTINVATTTLSNLRSNYKLRGIAKYQKQIPTLEEYLQAISQNKLHPVIEVKYDIAAGSISKLVATIRKYFRDDEVLIISFYLGALQKLKAVMNSQFFLVATADNTTNAKSNGIGVDLELSAVTQTVADFCNNNNIELVTWTQSGDGPAYLNNMINKGVRWLSTDTMPAYDFEKGNPIVNKKSSLNFSDFTLTSTVANEGAATIQAGGKIVNNGNVFSGKDVIIIEVEFKGKLTFKMANLSTQFFTLQIEHLTSKRVKLPLLNKVSGAYSFTIENTGSSEAIVTDIDFKIYNL